MTRLALFLFCTLISVVSSKAANIYWVSFHAADNTPSAAATAAGFTQAPDIGYTQLLEANGHTVTRVVTSGTPDVNLLNSAELVIISRSVPSGDYELDAETAAWNGITAPTIILGGYVLRNNRLGYTTGTTIPDTAGTVRLRALVPGHPVFAGIALDSKGVMVNPYANIVSYTNNPQRGISVNNNPVAGGGVVLGTIGTAGDPAVNGMIIGEWIAGATMATSPADTLGGHRLVLLTGSREASGLTAEAAGIYDLTAEGAQLLLNAVNYMTSGRIALITVDTVNNDSPGANETSLLEALSSAQDGDYIRFNIPGTGPHVIVTPLGGYPLITANNLTIDGYTQPGSAPNTNPILGGNNAQIQIVLDSTGADSGPSDPQDPGLNSRRSTRILHSGYGDTENGMLAVFAGDNFTVRGLSFIARRTPGSTADPSIYAVALVNQATGARIQGCWFGLAPGGSTLADVRPPSSAVAAFRYRTGGDVYSAGCTVGTDGDGVNDRAEFNVMLGGRITLAMEAPDLRVSGNYVNVFPNGVDFLDLDANYQLWVDVYEAAAAGGADVDPGDVTIENLENGRVADNTTIGTDGDGVSDDEERNIFNHVVYSHEAEVYSSGTNIVMAGNYFGVGIDGVTRAPTSTNIQPDFVELPGTSSIRVGSNGDGVSDEVEGNTLAQCTGSGFVVAGSSVPIVQRRNKLMNNGFDGVPFADGQNGRSYSAYYALALQDSSLGAVPILSSFTNGVLRGSLPAPSVLYPFTVIDIYTVDPAALANTNGVWPSARVHSLNWLGTYGDDSADDLDALPNQFAFDLSSFGLSNEVYLTVAVTYSSESANFNPATALTGPMSNPINERPILQVVHPAPDELVFWWFAAPNTYLLQVNPTFDPNNWLEIFDTQYYSGRNVVPQTLFFNEQAQFFRLISQ